VSGTTLLASAPRLAAAERPYKQFSLFAKVSGTRPGATGLATRALGTGKSLKTVAEYREHARECRGLADSVNRAEHKAALISMAETWEGLAEEREKRLAREAAKQT
jgi:hypothetical protein